MKMANSIKSNVTETGVRMCAKLNVVIMWTDLTCCRLQKGRESLDQLTDQEVRKNDRALSPQRRVGLD